MVVDRSLLCFLAILGGAPTRGVSWFTLDLASTSRTKRGMSHGVVDANNSVCGACWYSVWLYWPTRSMDDVVGSDVGTEVSLSFDSCSFFGLGDICRCKSVSPGCDSYGSVGMVSPSDSDSAATGNSVLPPDYFGVARATCDDDSPCVKLSWWTNFGCDWPSCTAGNILAPCRCTGVYVEAAEIH